MNTELNEHVSIVTKANEHYWKTGEDYIPDDEYHAHLEAIEEIDPDHPILSNIDTPKVSSTGKIKHEKFMLSLQKVYDIDGVIDWMKKVARSKNELFWMSPKYDGVAGSYPKAGVLATRGDGTEGENISHKIPWIKFISDHYPGFKGEIVVTENDFEHFFKSGVIKRGSGELYKTPRNALGILNNDNTPPIDEPFLTMVDYRIYGSDVTIDSVKGEFEMIKNANIFKKYPTDGLVFRLKDNEYAESLGATSHHYRHSLALKYKNLSGEAIIGDIVLSCGKEKLTPKAIFKEPVELSGVSIKQATLHNWDFVTEHKIIKGCRVVLERAGDVIPKVVKNLDKQDSSFFINVEQFRCPVCSSSVEYRSPELYCTNPDCEGKNLNRFHGSVKKLGYKNIAEATLKQLTENGLADSVPDLYTVKLASLLNLDGWGDRSVEKFAKELERVQVTPIEDWKILASLNIPGIGGGQSKDVLKCFTLSEIKDLAREEKYSTLEAIEGYSNKRARQLILGVVHNSELLDKTISIFQNILISKASDDKYTEEMKDVCFTGKLDEPRTVYEKHATNVGLNPVSSVSRSLDMLVVPDKSWSSSKTKKAERYDITILTIDEFKSIYGENKNL